MKNLMKNGKIRNFLIILMLFALEACISRVEKHGYMFELSDYQYLEEGVTTQDKAMLIMGSPTFTSYLGESEIWVYYSEEVRKILFFKPDIVKRKVLTLKFDESKVLQNLENYDLKNEKSLRFASGYTKVKSKKVGFFSSLFGNIGSVTSQ